MIVTFLKFSGLGLLAVCWFGVADFLLVGNATYPHGTSAQYMIAAVGGLMNVLGGAAICTAFVYQERKIK